MSGTIKRDASLKGNRINNPLERLQLERLRHLLHGEHSEEVWQDITKLLKSIQNNILPLALEYLAEHLASWPACVKRWHRSDSVEAWLHNPPPWWSLVNALAFKRSKPYNPAHRAIEALSDSPSLAHLTCLEFKGYHIGSGGIYALVQSPYVSNLNHLYLECNNAGSEGAIAVAYSPHLRNLTHLHFKNNKIGNQGLIALANSSIMKTITHLDLSKNIIAIHGVEVLASSPYAINLAYLNLKDNNFKQRRLLPIVVKTLRESPYLLDSIHLDI